MEVLFNEILELVQKFSDGSVYCAIAGVDMYIGATTDNDGPHGFSANILTKKEFSNILKPITLLVPQEVFRNLWVIAEGKVAVV
jgi:hypothetical protein